MVTHSDNRKTIRLNIDHGMLRMLRSGLGILSCSLHNLSVSGCGVRIVCESTETALLQSWAPLLKCGAEMDVELLRPPYFNSLKMRAQVTHSECDADGNPDLGLHFINADALQTAVLERAVNATATDKIRHMSKSATHAAFDDSAVETPPPPVNVLEDHEPSHADLRIKSLAEVLVMLRLLTAEQAAEAEIRADVERVAFPRFLLKQRLLKPDDLCRALALHSGLPTVNLKDRRIPEELIRVYSYLTMLRHDFVPFAVSKETLSVAAGVPLPAEVVNELSRGCNKDVLVFLTPLDQVRSQLFKIRPRSPSKERQHPRVKASIAVAFQYCDENGLNFDDEIHTGEALDISEGGFLVDTKPPGKLAPQYLLEHRAQVRLEFSLHPDEIHALCLIRHIETPLKSPGLELHWQIGLQIVDLPARELNALHELCAKASITQRGAGYQIPR